MAGQIIKRGDGFTIRVYVGRNPATGKRIYLNRTVRGTKKDAERALVALLRKRDIGDLVLEPTRLTVEEYLREWLERAAAPRVRARTLEDYEGLLRRYIFPHVGTRRLTTLTPMDIQGVYGSMLARGLSARTVRYSHAVLSSALQQAVKWRMLANNPAQHVDLPKQQKNELRAMTQDEAERFLKAAAASKHFALFALLIGTGLRPGEAVALRWNDFDAMAKSISVNRSVSFTKEGPRFHPPKSRRSRRTVALPDHLVGLLLEHRDQDGEALMFPGKAGGPLDIRTLASKHFKAILRRAGLSDRFRLYDLRHAHATLLLLAGVHPKVVSERLGHASVMLTLDTYSHVLPGMQEESARKLNSLLFRGNETASDRSFGRPN